MAKRIDTPHLPTPMQELILGVDPGLRVTGYGLIRKLGSQYQFVTGGYLRPSPTLALYLRVREIFAGIHALIELYQPDIMALEAIFMHKNPDSALKLGQARGAVLCAGSITAIPVAEYSARTIKLAVTGTGAASKDQVQHMVRVLLGLHQPLLHDTTDALAVALCHAHTAGLNARLRTAAMTSRRSA